MPRQDESKDAEGESREPVQRDVGIPVKVQVIVEEETFSPFLFDGVCADINRTGALVIVHNLTRQTYAKMIQRPRYVRTMCQFPKETEPVALFGKLVGYDFSADASGSVCRLAIAFEPMKSDVMTVLERYLASLSSTFPKPA